MGSFVKTIKKFLNIGDRYPRDVPISDDEASNDESSKSKDNAIFKREFKKYNKEFQALIDSCPNVEGDYSPVVKVACYEKQEKLLETLIPFFNLHKNSHPLVFDPNYKNGDGIDLLNIFLYHGKYNEAGDLIQIPEYKMEYLTKNGSILYRELPFMKKILDFSDAEQSMKTDEKLIFYIKARSKGFNVSEYGFFGRCGNIEVSSSYWRSGKLQILWSSVEDHEPNCSICHEQIEKGNIYFGRICTNLKYYQSSSAPPDDTHACAFHVECILAFISSIMNDYLSDNQYLHRIPLCPHDGKYEINIYFIMVLIELFSSKSSRKSKNLLKLMKIIKSSEQNNSNDIDNNVDNNMIGRCEFDVFSAKLQLIILRPDIVNRYYDDINTLIEIGISKLNQCYYETLFLDHPHRSACSESNGQCSGFILMDPAEERYLRCPKCSNYQKFQGRNFTPMTKEEKRIINNQVLESKGKIQACPQCKRLIEKNGGCDHMDCIFCKNRFIWNNFSEPSRLVPYPEIMKEDEEVERKKQEEQEKQEKQEKRKEKRKNKKMGEEKKEAKQEEKRVETQKEKKARERIENREKRRAERRSIKV